MQHKKQIIRAPKNPTLNLRLKMKKLISLLLLALCALQLNADNLKLPDAVSIINPLERKVLEIKETNIFNEKLFDPNIKTPTRSYKAYFDGENTHYKEAFPVKSRGIDMKNVRDVYLNGNTIYCVDSIASDSMLVCDADFSDKFSTMRLKNMFFSYFSKPRDILNAKIPCDISKGNGQYFISYDENDVKNLLCIDEKHCFP